MVTESEATFKWSGRQGECLEGQLAGSPLVGGADVARWSMGLVRKHVSGAGVFECVLWFVGSFAVCPHFPSVVDHRLQYIFFLTMISPMAVKGLSARSYASQASKSAFAYACHSASSVSPPSAAQLHSRDSRGRISNTDKGKTWEVTEPANQPSY